MTDTRSRASGSPVSDVGPRAGAGHPLPAQNQAPARTGSQLTRALGWLALPALALWALYGLVWSDPEQDMGESVRLFYVHVPISILLGLTCAITSVASAMWLRRRTPGWDALAVSSAELAAVFGVLTLVTGAIWGRPTWGTYWTWDPRLTTSAMLLVLIIGYLALRQVAPAGGVGGSVPAALVGLLLLPNVVLVRYSVEWWPRSLHQRATLLKLDPSIEGNQLVAAMLGYLAGGLVFAWLLIHRFRVAHLEQQAQRYELDAAVAARRAEAERPATKRPDTEGSNTQGHDAVPPDAVSSSGSDRP